MGAVDNGLMGGALAALSIFDAPVFPCRAHEKTPATARGYKDASKDEAQTFSWWSECETYNPALATGSIIVIDFDDHRAKGGGCGIDRLEEWEAEHGKLPVTATVKTGSERGIQMYFANPDRLEIRNSTNAELDIDVRGFGGYVMLPPSIHPNGNVYRWLEGREPEKILAPLDEQVLSFIEWVQPSAKKTSDGASQGAITGYRNNALFGEACRLQGLGLPDETIRSRMDDFNQTVCNPPLDEREVTRTIDSALRYKKGDGSGLVAHFCQINLYNLGFNDKVLGQVFADCFRNMLAFVPEEKSWISYDGTRWVRSGAAERAAQLMKLFVDNIMSYAVGIGDDDRKSNAVKNAARYLQHNARANVLDDAKSEMVVSAERFDSNPTLLNVANATIDFSGEDVEIREHRPGDYITMLAPVDYNGEADCALFKQTLANALEGDCEFMEFYQKLYGKVAAGDSSDDRFYLLGERPRTGKSTLTAPLVEMLGAGRDGYAKNVQPQTFACLKNRNASSASSDRARLKGARLIITSEPPEGMELDASLIKELTGGDLITARQLYSSEIQFRVNGLILMLANQFPTVNDSSVFASGRAVVLPFRHAFAEAEQDKSLRQRLKQPDELSGLLNFCIEGFRMYRADGYNLPYTVREASAEYEQRCDGVANFLAWGLVADPEAMVTAKELWAEYQSWCKGHGASPSIQKQEFYGRLRQRACWRDTSTIDGKTVKRVIEGYRLK